MNLYIAAFLALGCVFGLATFTNRHLFSEGPEGGAPDGGKGAWFFWVAMSTLLWPILVLSGLNTAWVLAKRKARASESPIDPGL